MSSVSHARRTSVLAAGAALIVAAIAAPAYADDDAAGSGERTAPVVEPKQNRSGDQTVVDLTGDLTAEEVVESLVGEGVTVGEVTYTGNPLGGGLAGGFEPVFGVPGGVVLSSGSVAGDFSNLIGPNESPAMTTDLEAPGDDDLSALVGVSTYDATVLEFDFVPETDQIAFDYVFGSEEYNEYVGSQYNDVFAFFVNGQNCAVVGADDAPVSINTINNGSNPDLYVDNEDAAHETELDGFTTVLTCVAAVQAGETNHVKLAIADASDSVLDSTVLIAAGTFSANHPPVADDLQAETVVDTPVELTLTGSDADGDPITFELASEPANGTLSGEAPDLTYTPGEGYTGEDTFTFTVTDGVTTSEPATVTITVVDEPTPTPTPTPTEDPEPTPSPTDTGEPLPDTGTGAGLPLGAAAVLALAGAALLLARRRVTA